MMMLTTKNSSCKNLVFFFINFLLLISHYQLISTDLLGTEKEYWSSLDVYIYNQIFRGLV
jgi:hypothetical protein